jgi:beta-lactamase class A
MFYGTMLSMRLPWKHSGLAVITAFMMTATAQTPPRQTKSAALEKDVQAIAKAHHGDVALFAEDLKTGETVAIAADTPVQTASVIKLAILYEALEQLREGKVHWEDQITLNKADQVPGSGVLLFFDTPLPLTLKDVLTLMIVMSDNTAANLAMDKVGIPNVNRRLEVLGLKDTYLYKKVFTANPPGVVMPADQKKFGLGKTTACEMATLLTKIVTCDLAEPDAPARTSDMDLCAVALHMLHLQFYRNAIPRYLDGLPGATGDSIANKTGSLDAARNDVAAVSTKNGLIVISCFTFNNQDHSWGTEQEGELTIAKIAREIVKTWSPDGMAAWPAPDRK